MDGWYTPLPLTGGLGAAHLFGSNFLAYGVHLPLLSNHLRDFFVIFYGLAWAITEGIG